MIIRSGRPGDQPGVSQVVGHSITNQSLYTPEARNGHVQDLSPRLIDAFLRQSPPRILVAEVEATIVGAAILTVGGGVGNIDWVCVPPGRRGMKVGPRLYAAVLEEAKRQGCHKATCWCLATNRSVRRYLARFGGHEVVHLSNHWYGQDHIFWEIPLLPIGASPTCSDGESFQDDLAETKSATSPST